MFPRSQKSDEQKCAEGIFELMTSRYNPNFKPETFTDKLLRCPAAAFKYAGNRSKNDDSFDSSKYDSSSGSKNGLEKK